MLPSARPSQTRVVQRIRHLDKALHMLASIPEAEQRLVEENMPQTTYAYVAMLTDIRRPVDARPRG